MRMPRLTLVTATVLLILGATSAHAQCTITGPTSICPGTTIELCGPTLDNQLPVWQGPDGMIYMTECIDVDAAGLYTLMYLDQNSNTWSAPCSLTVAPATTPPAVTGATTTCAGTTTQWCGPTGNLEYAWSGPNGFMAATACVSVGTAGNYQLKVRPLPDGCWTDSTVRTLTVNNCGGPKTSCPRPAWWWERQVSRRMGMGADMVAQVASCVNGHDSFFNWTSPSDGFRRTLEAFHWTLKQRAARQVAAAWANVCAGGANVMDHGTAVTLDPAATLTLPGTSGTVGDWLAAADAQLIALDSQGERSQAVKSAYRRIIQVAWSINHGIGIGSTCLNPVSAMSSLSSGTADAASLDTTDPEPLLSEMMDDTAGPLALGDLSPNPFTSTTRLAFAIATTSAADVSISVYDINGRKVRELVSGSFAPGQYETSWDGRATDGTTVKSGMYFVLGRIGGQQVQSRVTFVR
jgi:FlgD Ig-like domain